MKYIHCQRVTLWTVQIPKEWEERAEFSFLTRAALPTTISGELSHLCLGQETELVSDIVGRESRRQPATLDQLGHLFRAVEHEQNINGMADMQTCSSKRYNKPQTKVSKQEVYYTESVLEKTGTEENSLQLLYVIEQFGLIREQT